MQNPGEIKPGFVTRCVQKWRVYNTYAPAGVNSDARTTQDRTAQASLDLSII